MTHRPALVRRALRWTTTPTTDDPAEQLFLLCDTLADLVRCEGPDLTARQMTALLTVYLMAGPHTVRGLAGELNVPRPAITRALDRLGASDLVRRTPDVSDRRSVLAQQTRHGWAFLRDLGQIMATAAGERASPRPAARQRDGASTATARRVAKAALRGRSAAQKSPARARPPAFFPPGAPHKRLLRTSSVIRGEQPTRRPGRGLRCRSPQRADGRHRVDPATGPAASRCPAPPPPCALQASTSLRRSTAPSLRGILSLLIGLFVATVGMGAVGGAPRFTVGSTALTGGLAFVTAMIGLFAVAEILRALLSAEARRPFAQPRQVQGTFHGVGGLPRRHRKNILRGSVLGTTIGAGGDIAAGCPGCSRVAAPGHLRRSAPATRRA